MWLIKKVRGIAINIWDYIFNNPVKSILIALTSLIVIFLLLSNLLFRVILPLGEWYIKQSGENLKAELEEAEQKREERLKEYEWYKEEEEPPLNTGLLRNRIDNYEQFNELEDKVNKLIDNLHHALYPEPNKTRARRIKNKLEISMNQMTDEFPNLPETMFYKKAYYPSIETYYITLGKGNKLNELEKEEKEYVESIPEEYMKHKALREWKKEVEG